MNTGSSFGSHRVQDGRLLEDTTRSSDTSSDTSFETASERTLRPSTSQDLHMANAVTTHLAIDVIMRDFLDAVMNGGIVAFWRSNPDGRWRLVLDENNFQALFMRMLSYALPAILPPEHQRDWSGRVSDPRAGDVVVFDMVSTVYSRFPIQDEDTTAPILDMHDIKGYRSQLTVSRGRGSSIVRCLIGLLCDSELVPTVITVRDVMWVMASVVAGMTGIFALGAYHGAFLVVFIDSMFATMRRFVWMFTSAAAAAMARGVGGDMCDV